MIWPRGGTSVQRRETLRETTCGCPILSAGKGGGRIHEPEAFRRSPSPTLRCAKNGAPRIQDASSFFIRRREGWSRTATVPGATDIYLAGQPDGATVTWNCPPLVGWTSTAPQHSPERIDISAFARKELQFTATGVVNTGANNRSYPDGQNYGLRVKCLSQANGLTKMPGFMQGGLVGVFLTNDPPTAAGLSSSFLAFRTGFRTITTGSPRQISLTSARRDAMLGETPYNAR